MSFLRNFLDALCSMPAHGPDAPMIYVRDGRVCRWPYCECHRAGEADALGPNCRAVAGSPYAHKCKRYRVNGPTPCLCCEGECHGNAVA